MITQNMFQRKTERMIFNLINYPNYISLFYEKSLFLRTIGATRVQIYRATQSQLDTILTQTAAMLEFRVLKSELGLK